MVKHAVIDGLALTVRDMGTLWMILWSVFWLSVFMLIGFSGHWLPLGAFLLFTVFFFTVAWAYNVKDIINGRV